MVDENETVETAGLRELKEETGYTATKVSKTFTINPPLIKQYHHSFLLFFFSDENAGCIYYSFSQVIFQVLSLSEGKQGLDPGLTDDSVNFLRVEIDGDAEENKNPVQKLDEAEHVEVKPVMFNFSFIFCLFHLIFIRKISRHIFTFLYE